MRSRPAALTALILFALLVAGCAAPAASPTSAAPQVTEIPVTASSPVPASTLPDLPTNTQPTAGQTTTAPTAPAAASGGSALTFTIVPKKSEARYRVTEQLVNRDLPNDAVGATKEINGSVTLLPDGTIDSANSKITVNLASLATDQSRRDNFVRGNILQTDQYPEATFVPRSISGLSFPLPESGQVSFQVTGDLTIRDVTKPVTWDVTGSINGNQAVGSAKTVFTFAEFSLSQPRVPVVLSVEDRITLEADVTLQR